MGPTFFRRDIKLRGAFTVQYRRRTVEAAAAAAAGRSVSSDVAYTRGRKAGRAAIELTLKLPFS